MKSLTVTTSPFTALAIRCLLLLLLMSGCRYYYEVAPLRRVAAKDIQGLNKGGKYIIIHRNDSAWHLSVRSADSGLISGKLEQLPPDHRKYLTTNPKKGNNRYRKNKDNEIAVLDEVHLYVSDSLTPAFAAGDDIRLHPSVILRAELYRQNRGRTTASWVIPAVVVPVGLVAILVALAVVGKNSISINVSH